MIMHLFSAVLVLVYASAVMTLLLGIRPLTLKGTKRYIFWIMLPCIFFVNFISMALIDLQTFGILYPFIGQFPIFLVFYAVSGRGFPKTFFVLLTTMFLTFPYSSAAMLLNMMSPPRLLLMTGISMLVIILLMLAIRRFMVTDFAYMMDNIGTPETLKFCFIPFFYSILTYSIGKYTGGIVVWPLRCFLFLNTLVVYFLLMNAIRNASHMQLLQHEKDMLYIQMQTAKKHFEQLKAMQEHTMTYRHDLRHHISLLGSYAIDGDMDKIKDYLAAAQGDLDAITPMYFCENETVSLILSSFDSKAKTEKINLSVDAKLPKELAIPDTELCAVFSNSLENALNAASQVSDTVPRTVRVECFVKRDRLMLMIQNPYNEMIQMENGIPLSVREGHGFGSRSIAAIAERRNGYCTFTAEDGVFILRVILPLGKE